eukprot:1615880-Pyramimonas_sp.AAC.1
MYQLLHDPILPVHAADVRAGQRDIQAGIPFGVVGVRAVSGLRVSGRRLPEFSLLSATHDSTRPQSALGVLALVLARGDLNWRPRVHAIEA